MNQVNRILKLLVEIKSLIPNASDNSGLIKELAILKKQNGILKGQLTTLKNKQNEVK